MFIKVREILTEYDPNFMPMGLDEAYLNITEHLEERLNWPEDKRRHFFNTKSTTEKGKQITLFSCRHLTLRGQTGSFRDPWQNVDGPKS